VMVACGATRAPAGRSPQLLFRRRSPGVAGPHARRNVVAIVRWPLDPIAPDESSTETPNVSVLDGWAPMAMAETRTRADPATLVIIRDRHSCGLVIVWIPSFDG